MVVTPTAIKTGLAVGRNFLHAGSLYPLQSCAMNREFDIVVYGATGFTGKQTALELLKHKQPGTKLAIAGRRKNALEELAKSLPGPVGVIVADSEPNNSEPTNSHSVSAVDEMCARTRVLVTTAGPFTAYGSPVVAACAKNGTHYLDITGETPWVRDMINQHQATALQNRARLVPFSGYDSIPSELSAYLAVHALSEEARRGRVEVTTYHRGVGGFNGGTLATALLLSETGRFKETLDPFLLNDDRSRAVEVRDPRGVEAAVTIPLRGTVHPLPFFMGPVNTRVVRRSVELAQRFSEPWAESVRYQEYWAASSRVEAYVTAGLFGTIFSLLGSPTGRSLLRKVGPKPGAGPTQKAIDNGKFEAIAVAQGSDGTRSYAKVAGPGDPSNRVTVQCLIHSALCMAEDEAKLKPRYGFLTPTTAYAKQLIQRLSASGMTLESGKA